MNKVALLEAIARRWNSETIPYAVAHGIESYPNHVGRDLDVLTDARHSKRAIDLAQEVLESKGLVVIRPPPLWGERLVAAVLEPEPDLLEVHAVNAISWRFACLAAEPVPSIHVGPFAIDPWVRFAKRILLPALAAQTSKLMAELRGYPMQEAELTAAASRLPTMIGEALACSFQRAVQNRDEAAITRLVPLMRRAVTGHAWTRQPAAAIDRVAKGLSRRLRQVVSPCGPIVSIVGPPGSGKTVLQESICRGDHLVFTRCVAVPWSTPQAAAANQLQHWVRLAQHVIRGAARGLIADRLHSSRQQLVIYEGCATDLVVSARRFGLRSPVGARFCSRLLPKPDLFILLDVPAALLCFRRPQLSAQQVAHEYAFWNTFAATGMSVVALRGDRSVDELRTQATRLIVEAFIVKNRRPANRRSTERRI